MKKNQDSDDYEQPNAETLAAFQEIEDIKAGKIKAKTYANVEELFKDILEDDT